MKLLRLREWRERRGLTQQDLADGSGVSQNAISNYETGRRNARPSTARKLADALGVGIEDLIRSDPVFRALGEVRREAYDRGGHQEVIAKLEELRDASPSPELRQLYENTIREEELQRDVKAGKYRGDPVRLLADVLGVPARDFKDGVRLTDAAARAALEKVARAPSWLTDLVRKEPPGRQRPGDGREDGGE